MAKTRLFISFDYDHDEDLRNLFAGQAKHEDTPFEFTDASVKDTLTGDWEDKVRARIRGVDQVAVICGEYTHTAKGVGVEVSIAQGLKKPYWLLWGRAKKTCTKPKVALATDTIYEWTWENVAKLINGAR